jgi:surface polysaccharide O-acyltransferase-like enzyme
MLQESHLTSQQRNFSLAPTRLYYLDWLRVIAILGVWAYHSARPFMLQEWLINNTQKSPVITFVFLIFLGSMGMPLFFLMAGAGCTFALRRRTGRQFIAERAKRLLVPFIIGCILLSPVQFYFEWTHKEWYHGSFLSFIPVLVSDRLHLLASKFSPSIFESLGSHLWFLGFLFTFSLIALPLFLWVKDESGQKVIAWLGKLGEKRGGLLLFIPPIAAVRMSLQPFFPGYTDWADFAYMLVFFVCGYLIFSDQRLIQAIRRDWRLALSMGVISTLTMLVGLVFGEGSQWVKDPSTTGFYLGWGLVGVNGWCWTLFALWVGMRLLDFRSRWLDRAQELILPFYVFHQPPIVILAFFIIQWQTGILVKLSAVVLGSFVITLGLCEGIVRHLKPARILFGMKPSMQSDVT